MPKNVIDFKYEECSSGSESDHDVIAPLLVTIDDNNKIDVHSKPQTEQKNTRAKKSQIKRSAPVRACALNTDKKRSVHLSYTEFKKLCEGQKQIKKQLETLQDSVDYILQNMCQNSEPMLRLNEASTTDMNYVIKPISNLQELESLEDKLKDNNYLSKVVNAMTCICGDSGKIGSGINCCYKLIDYFFTRDVLLKISWTGSSRQEDQCKIALKYCHNVRNCFFKLVHKSDKTFTVWDCDKFFKCILRNATKRLNPKRMSTTRSRAKKVQQDLELVLDDIEKEDNQNTQQEELDMQSSTLHAREENLQSQGDVVQSGEECRHDQVD